MILTKDPGTARLSIGPKTTKSWTESISKRPLNCWNSLLYGRVLGSLILTDHWSIRYHQYRAHHLHMNIFPSRYYDFRRPLLHMQCHHHHLNEIRYFWYSHNLWPSKNYHRHLIHWLRRLQRQPLLLQLHISLVRLLRYWNHWNRHNHHRFKSFQTFFLASLKFLSKTNLII